MRHAQVKGKTPAERPGIQRSHTEGIASSQQTGPTASLTSYVRPAVRPPGPWQQGLSPGAGALSPATSHIGVVFRLADPSLENQDEPNEPETVVNSPVSQIQAERAAEPSAVSPAHIREAAAAGIKTPVSTLPYSNRIQHSFGHHDIGTIQAHLGPGATASSRAMGARAFATGSHVVMAGTPSLFTAAHEAAHVIQQRAGIQLPSGVGQVGDSHEQHADAIAQRVVAGKPADDLLDTLWDHSDVQPGSRPSAAGPVLRLIQRNVYWEANRNQHVLNPVPTIAQPAAPYWCRKADRNGVHLLYNTNDEAKAAARTAANISFFSEDRPLVKSANKRKDGTPEPEDRPRVGRVYLDGRGPSNGRTMAVVNHTDDPQAVLFWHPKTGAPVETAPFNHYHAVYYTEEVKKDGRIFPDARYEKADGAADHYYSVEGPRND